MSALPEDIERFVRKNFDSVEALSVLAFLCRNQGQAWTPEELNRQLRSSPASIRRRLAGLAQKRLVSRTGNTYTYDPAQPADAIVSRVLEYFRERQAAVIEAIFATSFDPLQSFADAFKLGGDDDR